MPNSKRKKPNLHREEEIPPGQKIEVKRFKGEDGREGSYAPIGNGLIKLLFDDGGMVILREMDSKVSDSSDSDNIPS